jgi:hypothetical protein
MSLAGRSGFVCCFFSDSGSGDLARLFAFLEDSEYIVVWSEGW